MAKRSKYNLVMEQFGKWHVIDQAESDTYPRWRARCECGTVRDVLESNLLSGKSRSCGCMTHNPQNRLQIAGQRFGKLLAVEEVGQNNRRQVMWRCQCDCGNVTTVSGTSLMSGNTRSCGCSRRDALIAKKLSSHPAWKGGRIFKQRTGVMLYQPDHPSAHKNGYVPEHRVIMEQSLGRKLSRTEYIIHRNGDKTDNRLENLELHSSPNRKAAVYE